MTNVVVVRGRLARPVGERVLPSGDRLAVLDVTVAGVPQPDGSSSRAESVPAAWFGAPAWLLDLESGAEVVLLGRVRKRFFQAAGLQSRTEVVVEAGAPARRTAKVADLLRRACDELGAGPTASEAAGSEGPGRRRGRPRAAPTFP